MRFTVFSDEDLAKLEELAIPGVRKSGRRFDCAWDSAVIVGEYLGCESTIQDLLNRRLACAVPMPGLQRYKDLGLNKLRRDYQQEAILYLLIRSWAVLGDPPRAGKTLDILAVHVLSGSKKLLVICPSLAKYVWGAEVARWLDEEALLLFGRAGADARTFCKTCRGAGFVEEGKEEDGTPITKRCLACNGLGEFRHVVNRLEPDQNKEVWLQDTGRLKKDGSPRMQRRVAVSSVWPPVFRCPRHTDVVDTGAVWCSKCQAEMRDLIARHNVVIANYDILGPQKVKADKGYHYFREDLPGWARYLGMHGFTMAALDESHRFRGFQPKKKSQKDQMMRREIVYDLVEPIPRVIALTGTFFYGFTRDGWAQLDCASKGLFS